MVGLFVMPSSTIFRQHTRLNAATNKTTKKISHTRRSPKDRNYPSTPFDKLPESPAGLSTRGKTARRPSKGAASFVQRLVDGCSDGRARDQTWPWVLRQRLGNQVHIGLAISGDTRRYTPPMCGLEWSGKPVGPRQYETCLPLWSESVCLPGRQSTVWYSRRRSRRFDRVCSLVPSSCSYS